MSFSFVPGHLLANKSPKHSPSAATAGSPTRPRIGVGENAQLAIDFEPRRAARSTDPVTSQHAAASAARFASSHAGRILACLVDHGPATAHELSHRTGLSVVQIDRRLPDLEKTRRAKVVMDTDGEPLVRGGARVWEAC